MTDNAMRPDEQNLSVGTIVSLYTIDARAIGGQLMRFVSGSLNGEQVVYQGNAYISLPIKVAGISYKTGGAAVRPTLMISRVNTNLVSAFLGTDGWRGATFTRLRTLAKYLDGEPAADAERHWPVETYRVEQKVNDDKTEITWQLASPVDFDKKKLPGRQILRDVCAWRYRVYDSATGAFDYSGVQCPYAGSEYFDRNDQRTNDRSADQCSRRLSGCKVRFGQVVPFSGFAGVGRV